MAPEHNRDLEERGRDNEKVLGRILAFSDGVFAIAILLLLIDIKLPAGTSITDLGAVLRSLWPNYLAFFISFVVIGLYWTAHVRLFREIVRYDWGLVWLNLLYLLFIVIIPFSTSVLSIHFTKLSVIMYAATIAAAGFSNTIVRIYSTKGHRLINNRFGNIYIKRAILLSLIAPTGFTISIGLAFLNPSVVQYFWIVMLVVHIIFLRRLGPQER
jgi:TMEM175 potassium channel family protein